jgi:hypothetical protein
MQEAYPGAMQEATTEKTYNFFLKILVIWIIRSRR